jgi:hypothetical protein
VDAVVHRLNSKIKSKTKTKLNIKSKILNHRGHRVTQRKSGEQRLYYVVDVG